MLGAYITIGILIAIILLLIFQAVYPKIKDYRISLRKIENKTRKRRVTKKKKKSVWIKVI